MTTTRLKQPSINEAEENDLKNNFRRRLQMLKEEMRNSFKEMEKKTNKNWKASTNPLKKTKKNQTRYSRLEN